MTTETNIASDATDAATTNLLDSASNVLDMLGQFTMELKSIAMDNAPDAWNLAVDVAWLSAMSKVSMSVLILCTAIVFACVAYRLCVKWYTSKVKTWHGEDRDEALGWAAFAFCMLTFIMSVVFLCSLNPMAIVGVFIPDAYLAYKLLAAAGLSL